MATDSAYERVAQRLADRTGYQPPNDKGDWRCPAHDDKSPSLSVTRAADKVLVKCHVGCQTGAILDALDLKPADLFDSPKANSNGKHAEPDAVYPYVDEQGTLLFQALRYGHGAGKTFKQRRPDGRGGWVYNLQDTRRVLYRLPRVLEAIRNGKTIVVVEGEKDVEAIERAGGVATCNPMGAGKWRPEYSEQLAGADIVIVADQDGTGIKHAADVEAGLSGKAKRIRVAQPASGCKDAFDHLAAGHALAELLSVPNRLGILSAAELVHRVENAPVVGWLIRRLWPADAHGVMAAEQKAGKTWSILDLAVSVATGTPWMGAHPIDTQGPVLIFLGEGGDRKMKRRLDAICTQRGVSLADLPLRLSLRVPHLTSREHLDAIDHEVEEHKPVLVIIDPLYLAARGAKTSQLNEMGEHLENIQHVAQRHGAALVIVHHWNKTGDGKGASRMSGVGGAEWGRVLCSISVRSKRTENDVSNVILDFAFEGDEIAEISLRVRRKVWVEDPDDLNSFMYYEVEPIEADEIEDEDEEGPGKLSPATKRVVHILDSAGGGWMTVRDIGDRLADEGHPLKPDTIRKSLKELARRGLAAPSGEAGSAYTWRSTTVVAAPASEVAS